MSRFSLKSPAVRVAGVIVAFVVVMAILYWPRGLPAPREENRAMHPAGYSIIVPPEWDSTVDAASREGYARDRLRLRPIHPGHWPPEIDVTRLRNPPDAAELKANEQFRDGHFGDVPALIFDGPVKKYWVYKVVFQRDGEWFELAVSSPDFENVEKSAWYAYLQSFRYPDPTFTGKTPSTNPTTGPTTFHIDLSK